MDISINTVTYPIISTQRLRLRQIDKMDGDTLFVLRTSMKVMQYLQRPMAKGIDEVFTLIDAIHSDFQSGKGITWAITLKNMQELIGTIGFWKIDKSNFRAEIGFMLHPNFQQQGFMDEALKEVTNFAFSELGIHSIEARVNPLNYSSIKLLTKNNFIKEGLLSQSCFFEGKYFDIEVYSLLKK